MFLRNELEERENEYLAGYAVKSSDSRGRVHQEAEHPYRLCFQRDRDRIIHSTAFRRLEYKTQVFVNHEGDHNRTRLTHTIEVAQIARTISRALGLNEDLTEAIAYAHDLGHTPFGHAGEKALNKLMKGSGGFEHNKQGLRVVDLLEYIYPDFRGLNLTFEIREAILKNNPPYADHPLELSKERPTLEARVVDIADEIAYNSHDLDDGINNGLLPVHKLTELAIWEENLATARQRYPKASNRKISRITVKLIIGQQVADIIRTSLHNLKENKITTRQKAQELDFPLIAMSEKMEENNQRLKRFLHQHMYQHYRMIRMSYKADNFLSALFEAFTDKPRLLPPSFQWQAEKEPLERVVSDYLAGMTDRYALDEYIKIFNPYER